MTKSTKHPSCVIIGRFQLIHDGYLDHIRQALSEYKHVVIVFEGDYASRSLRSPFTCQERKEMILGCLSSDEKKRVTFYGVRDHFYHPKLFSSEVNARVNEILKNEQRVVFLQKGNSSYNLTTLFSNWNFKKRPKKSFIHTADLRRLIFDGSSVNSIPHLPQKVKKWLSKNSLKRNSWRALVEEFQAVQAYQAEWKKSPYPPIFSTTDSLVIQGDRIILIRRKNSPGKGLLALPGGFLEEGETLLDGAIRELREESGIELSDDLLRRKLKNSYVFDYPFRSSRGRTITHAFCFHLSEQNLPELNASDDASHAMWVRISDLSKFESEFCEDHLQMIQHFLNNRPDKPTVSDYQFEKLFDQVT